MKRKECILGLSLLFVFLTACPLPNDKKINTLLINGQIELPSTSSIKATDLKVVSLLSSTSPWLNGNFSLQIADIAKPQIVFCQDQDGKTILMGYVMPTANSQYNPSQVDKISVNAESTALAFVMTNYYLIYTSGQQRAQLAEKIKNMPDFEDLVLDIEDILVNNPSHLLDSQLYPQIYEKAINILIAALKNSSAQYMIEDKTIEQPSNPWLEDRKGNEVAFINPRYIHYGTGIYDKETSVWQQTILVRGVERYISVVLKWPPEIKINKFKETLFDLEEGDWRLDMSKGFKSLSVDDLLKWDTPQGRGTIYNSGKGILFIIDLCTGLIPSDIKVSNLKLDAKSNVYLGKIGKNFIEKDLFDLVKNFVSLIKENIDEIAQWLTDTIGLQIKNEFLESSAEFLANLSAVLKGLSLLNEEIPYFYDLMLAQGEITYYASQENGELEYNCPPTARILQPEYQRTFTAGETIIFEGEYYDLETDFGEEGTSLTWSSDKDGFIFNGQSFSTDDLENYFSVGNHEIVLSATDPQGDSGYDRIKITIKENYPPSVVVLFPLPNSEFTQGDSIFFRGSAFDQEDEILDLSSFVWTSDKDGQFQIGNSFEYDMLSANEHIITLTVADKYGLKGSATRTINVKALPIEEIVNGETKSGYVEKEKQIYYLFNVPAEANLVQITLSDFYSTNLDLYAKLNAKPSLEDFDYRTRSIDRFKFNDNMLVLINDGEYPIKSGTYYLMIHAYTTVDYELTAQYFTEPILNNLSITYEPNPATEFEYDWLSSAYYWKFNLKIQNLSNIDVELTTWSFRNTEFGVEENNKSQLNTTDKIDAWFYTTHVPANGAIEQDLHMETKEKPIGIYQPEDLFIGKDDNDNLVYGIGMATFIGQESSSQLASGAGENKPSKKLNNDGPMYVK